jgi:LmbE family N-acetylglucosaminyl deacetylase
MKKVKKIGIVIILIVVSAFAANIIYLFTLTPKEKYPEDSYLKNESKKTALIMVAHDDDAVVFSGTTSLLAANGWNISYVCFYNDFWKTEDNPKRRLEIKKVTEIQGFKNYETIDFTVRISPDTIAKPWLPEPYDKFPEKFKVDSMRMYIQEAINKYNPSVIFTLDNVIGLYGHPEHVLVGQLVEEICSLYKDSSDFPVKKIYQVVLPYSQAEKIMKKVPTYSKGKRIYGCNGMPSPDVQINISSFAAIKKEVFLAHASQHQNLERFYPYYHIYPGWLYFGIFNKEYFRIINVDEL